MTVTTTLAARNTDFAATRFSPDLQMMPSLRTIIIGCVDPRVDPFDILGLAGGETAILRNVGGRVTPATLGELVMLRAVTQAAGGDLGAGWELVVLQHTDCGITRLDGRPDLLGSYFGVTGDDLSDRAIGEPVEAVAHDVQVLRADTRLGAGVRVTGVVYDVATGLVDVVCE